MAIPYPPPDPVELAEYLAQYLRREIKAGKFTQADLQDIPEIGLPGAGRGNAQGAPGRGAWRYC